MTTFADEPFRTLLTRYCEKKGLVVAETCLNLDGDKLDLDTKPEDEDLEGGGVPPTPRIPSQCLTVSLLCCAELIDVGSA